MEEHCGSTFWNKSLAWETNEPDLTECFEKTVLVWTPCIFLWIFCPFEISYIVQSKQKDIPWGLLNIAKFLIAFLLIILSATDFFTAIYYLINEEQHITIYNVDIVSPFMKTLSFTLTALLIMYNRKNGRRSSGLQFLFWFLLVLCATPQFRREVLKTKGDAILHVTYLIYYPLALLMLLLNCFADKPPRYTEYPKSEKECPEESASFPSRMCYRWFDALAWKGFKKPLEATDLWHIKNEDTAREVVPLFEQHWQKSVKEAERSHLSYPRAEFKSRSGRIDFVDDTKKKTASVLPAICKSFGPTFLFGAMLKLIQCFLIFASPQILKLLITFTEDKQYYWRGYLYVVCLFLTGTLHTFIGSQYFERMSLIGMRIRTALISSIYKKALKMSNSAKKESALGEMVNLMAVDAQIFVELTPYINMLWSAPLEIILALYFLWDVLGVAVLAGIAVMVVLIPLNGVIANRMKILQMKQLKNKDERVKLMNEILNGIKVLKLYAWEPRFQAQVSKIRNKEINVLKQAAYVHSGTSFIWSCAPYLVTLLTFVAFIHSDETHILTPQIAFVSISLFATLHFVMGAFPLVVVWSTEAWVSLKRINKFMNLEELDPESVQHDQTDETPIVIESGNFSWGEDLILANINVSFEKGGLTAIVGSVGSGKSSLISAILGEMDKISGRVNTNGSLAYVAQQAWIQNATLQNNIIFGKSMEQKFYTDVIESCALKPDFDMLPAGDQTEIGEKGINVSGGQKQRVSLARAVYSNADVYLLDDPLSAVDSHVGKHIFDKVIGPEGLLKETTRLLVTHSVNFLPMVDKIIVLKDGSVSESGTYQELLDRNGAFAEFLLQHLNETKGGKDDEENDDALKEAEKSDALVDKMNGSLSRAVGEEEVAGETLIEEEKVEKGGVKWTVYKHYFRSIGVTLSIAMVFSNIAVQAFNIGSNIWLSTWSEDKNVTSTKRDVYLAVYGVLGFAQVLSTFLAALTLFIGALNGARILHKLLLVNVLKAPCNLFFDVTPVGRILNRFSQDIDTIDGTLPMIIRGFNNCFFGVLATLFVISYTTPIFMAVIIPIGVLYYLIQRFYVATSRQLKRIEAVSRSPIYSHFSETVAGASSIRAYGEIERFVQESEAKVDFNQVCNYPSIIANRWLAVRLEMVGNIVILFAALFAVRDQDDNPGLVGLSIAYALQITATLNVLVQMSSEIETNIVSVERIKEYEDTPHEAPWNIPHKTPPETWPSEGSIMFKDFAVRYRPGLELVLKNLNFSINGGEKVGIVGRTGSGKSTLTLSLFRLLEGSQGEIMIDGINIGEIGLHSLRSRLTIIPQDAVLFSGSLRMNLDPFEKYTDEELWKSLQQANLKEFVQGLTAGLNHEITEGGENLSVGQRQLVCLSRALLRKTKLLVLDEATAAVDLETDDVVQRTIKTEFRQSTILTIAHRLNTIMDSDKIIVFDKGCIAEIDTPNNLLNNKKSVFYGMAKDAGLA